MDPIKISRDFIIENTITSVYNSDCNMRDCYIPFISSNNTDNSTEKCEEKTNEI